MAGTPPEGYHHITPSFTVDDAPEFIDFVTEVLGATERFRTMMPDGSFGHAEVEIGDSAMMVGQTSEFTPATSNSLYVYVDDVDATHSKALAAGATSTMEPDNMFWGDRTSSVTDPFGNTWSFAKNVEQISPEEMETRMAAMGQPS